MMFGSLLNEKGEKPQRGTGNVALGFSGETGGALPPTRHGASPGDGSPAGINCDQVEGAPWGLFGL